MMRSTRAVAKVLAQMNLRVDDGERTFRHARVHPQFSPVTEMGLRVLQNFLSTCFTYSHYV